MSISPLTGALCTLALFAAAPLGAQSLSTMDDGQTGLILTGNGGPSVQAPGSLTTTFASNNQFAGNMFDITPTADLTITGVDINCTNAGTNATIDVWYLVGSSLGNESNAAAWTFLGSYAGISAGQDLPTFMDMAGNGMTFVGGTTYGLYIDLTSYSAQSFRYTNGAAGGTLFSNADLSLLTNAGKGSGFSGSTFQVRDWNGTIYYDAGPSGPSLSVTGACPGTVTFDIAGATPFAGVALAYGGAGSFTIPGGSCGGTVVDIASPTLATILGADAAGSVTFSAVIPAGACGLTVQAVDLSACAPTNTIVL